MVRVIHAHLLQVRDTRWFDTIHTSIEDWDWARALAMSKVQMFEIQG